MMMLERLEPLIEPLKEFEVIIESDRYCHWLKLKTLDLCIFWDEGFDNEWDFRVYDDEGTTVFRSVLEREVIEFIQSIKS